LNYGRFINSIVSFLFTTVVLFIIYKSLKMLKAAVEKEGKVIAAKAKAATGGLN